MFHVHPAPKFFSTIIDRCFSFSFSSIFCPNKQRNIHQVLDRVNRFYLTGSSVTGDAVWKTPSHPLMARRKLSKSRRSALHRVNLSSAPSRFLKWEFFGSSETIHTPNYSLIFFELNRKRRRKKTVCCINAFLFYHDFTFPADFSQTS